MQPPGLLVQQVAEAIKMMHGNFHEKGFRHAFDPRPLRATGLVPAIDANRGGETADLSSIDQMPHGALGLKKAVVLRHHHWSLHFMCPLHHFHRFLQRRPKGLFHQDGQSRI